MNDEGGDRRRRYFDDYRAAVDRHRERAFAYEGRAIEVAQNAFRSLTYLNGGALVAVPTAVAMFRSEVGEGKLALILAVGCFVIGLVLVVCAQVSALFTMERRSEAEQLLQYEQMVLLGVTHYPGTEEQQAERVGDAVQYRQRSGERETRANYWRLAGILLFWLSVVAFVFGCLFAARAVLTA